MRVTVNPEGVSYRVSQGEIAITDHDCQELKTSALYTCSGLIIVGQGKRLLAHCDASSDPEIIARVVSEYFDITDPNIRIEGVLGASNNIEIGLSKLGVDRKFVRLSLQASDNTKDLVVASSGAVFVRDNELAPQTRRIGADGLTKTFITNAPPDRVTDLGDGRIRYVFGLGGADKERIYEAAEIGPPVGGLETDVGIYQSLE